MITPPTPNVVIVGATGLVGRELLALIGERRFPFGELRLLASAGSAGTAIEVRGAGGGAGGGAEDLITEHAVEPFDPARFRGANVVFFCSSGKHARDFAPAAVEAGAIVIDNSSAFRMDPEVPLVVPEINGNEPAAASAQLIANPNCSTILVLMATDPLRRAVGIERMVVSTYQAASGGGRAMMDMLEQQSHAHVAGAEPPGRPYLFNVFSHDSPVGPDGANEEERKLVRETRRIWNDPTMRVAATCIRVPVLRAHCAAINVTLEGPLDVAEARRLIDAAPGVSVVDDRTANRFPEPVHASGRDDVLVGRIRADDSQPDGLGLSLFIAGDQLRKGAALNALQIAETRLSVPETSAAVSRS